MEGARGPRRRTQHLPTRTSARAPRRGRLDGVADGLAEDARAAAGAITEEDTKTVKVRYDAAVTAAHFEFIEAEIAAAAYRRGRAPATFSRRPSSSCRGPIRAPRRRSRTWRGRTVRKMARHPPPPPRRRRQRRTSSRCLAKNPKKKKRAGAGAAPPPPPPRGGKMPSLDAVLSQLAKKQTSRRSRTCPRGAWGARRPPGAKRRRGGGGGARRPRRRGGRPVRTLRLHVGLRSRRVGRKPRRHFRRARGGKTWPRGGRRTPRWCSCPRSERRRRRRDAKVAAAKATAAGGPSSPPRWRSRRGKCDAVEGPEGAEEAREGEGAPEAKVGTVR